MASVQSFVVRFDMVWPVAVDKPAVSADELAELEPGLLELALARSSTGPIVGAAKFH